MGQLDGDLVDVKFSGIPATPKVFAELPSSVNRFGGRPAQVLSCPTPQCNLQAGGGLQIAKRAICAQIGRASLVIYIGLAAQILQNGQFACKSPFAGAPWRANSVLGARPGVDAQGFDPKRICKIPRLCTLVLAPGCVNTFGDPL